MAVSANAEQAFVFLTDRDSRPPEFRSLPELTPVEAAAAIGNFQQESYKTLDTTAFNKGEGAYGIGQWRNDRQDGLTAYAASVGRDKSDLLAQLGWTLTELTTTHRGALTAMRAAGTVEEATRAFAQKFEVTKHGYDNREANARNVAAALGSNPQLASAPRTMVDGSPVRQTAVDILAGAPQRSQPATIASLFAPTVAELPANSKAPVLGTEVPRATPDLSNRTIGGYIDSNATKIDVVNGITDRTSTQGMTPHAVEILEAAKQAAAAAGLSQIVVTAGKGSGHLSHAYGTEWDIKGYNADGSLWNNAQRVAVAAGANQAGADRLGIYRMEGGLGGGTLHLGYAGKAGPAAMWGAGGHVRGPESRNYTDPAEKAFYQAYATGKPFDVAALGLAPFRTAPPPLPRDNPLRGAPPAPEPIVARAPAEPPSYASLLGQNWNTQGAFDAAPRVAAAPEAPLAPAAFAPVQQQDNSPWAALGITGPSIPGMESDRARLFQPPDDLWGNPAQAPQRDGPQSTTPYVGPNGAIPGLNYTPPTPEPLTEYITRYVPVTTQVPVLTSDQKVAGLDKKGDVADAANKAFREVTTMQPTRVPVQIVPAQQSPQQSAPRTTGTTGTGGGLGGLLSRGMQSIGEAATGLNNILPGGVPDGGNPYGLAGTGFGYSAFGNANPYAGLDPHEFGFSTGVYR